MSAPVATTEAERRAQAELAKQRLLRAYQATWETDFGREVLKDLLEFSGINRDGVSEAMTETKAIDPMKLAYFTGSRRVGIRIASFLDMTAQQAAARHVKPKDPPQTKART